VIFTKLTNININKKQVSILAVVTAIAIVMTVSPVGMNFSNNVAFAGGKDHDNNDDDDDNDGNSASQIIAQVQRSIQNSQVVSGGDTEDSGNNFNFQNQENKGNNALAQSNDDDDNDGNSASQAIVQSQSSRQNSQVVSGGDTEDSGNNFNFQNQENSGNNALAQQ
jgi:preprotein translocase subunit SecF